MMVPLTAGGSSSPAESLAQMCLLCEAVPSHPIEVPLPGSSVLSLAFMAISIASVSVIVVTPVESSS